MKPYVNQELEQCGIFSKLFSGKPTENAWTEVNNILADADRTYALTQKKLKEILKKWGAKLDDTSLTKRSALYRKFSDVIYSNAQSSDDPLFAEGRHLADVLQLPPHLIKLADKGARQAAYFTRCSNLLRKQESLPISEINKIFGYDYDDGFSIRKQVFQDYFNALFIKISERQRFSPEEEASLKADCATIDIPYEFKNNIVNALNKYRDLWNAENIPLVEIPIDFPLNGGEICHAAAQAGLYQNKIVEKEDNYFDLTRKFSIDETVTFKGEKIEYPKTKEEITALLDIGSFFLTNQRIIFFSRKTLQETSLGNITGAELNINIITFHRKSQDDLIYKYSDEAAEAMYIFFNRVYAAYKT
ncbi:MAG: hypothetical protein LUF25_01595 [Phascolarctobacterium sp.]|nr:hypothetical protein [Phascolarctobacterium sp.]